MTTTLFIDRFFRGLPNYISCIPSDHVLNVKKWSQTLQTPCFFIVNTSPSHIQSIGHWMVVVIYNIERCELFDSLALPLEQLPVEILTFLSKFKKVTFSPRSIQSPLSNFCGIFSIARALSACLGETLADFYRNFQGDFLYKNDLLATKYVLDNISSLY